MNVRRIIRHKRSIVPDLTEILYEPKSEWSDETYYVSKVPYPNDVVEKAWKDDCIAAIIGTAVTNEHLLAIVEDRLALASATNGLLSKDLQQARVCVSSALHMILNHKANEEQDRLDKMQRDLNPNCCRGQLMNWIMGKWKCPTCKQEYYAPVNCPCVETRVATEWRAGYWCCPECGKTDKVTPSVYR